MALTEQNNRSTNASRCTVLDRSRLWPPLDSHVPFTHLNWADNVFLVSSSEEGVRLMVQELSLPFYWARLHWKPPSLEVLCAVHGRLTTPLIAPGMNGELLRYSEVPYLDALGVRVDPSVSTRVCVGHRLACDNVRFNRRRKHLVSSDTPLVARLVAFSRTASASALHGCEGWALDSACPSVAKGWEFSRL